MYFSNGIEIVTTVTLCLLIAYILFHVIKGKSVKCWGRRTALLAAFGLLVCCFAATRDNYHLSVQASFDKSVSAGLFTLQSIQSTLGAIGGGIIALSGICSIFLKKQKTRRILFYLMSVEIIMKIIVVEISRITM